MPRRRISPLFAVFVAFVVLMASNAWLKSIFCYGEIATDIPFLLAGAVLFLAWRFNRRRSRRSAPRTRPKAPLLPSRRVWADVASDSVTTPPLLSRLASGACAASVTPKVARGKGSSAIGRFHLIFCR